MAVRPPYSMLEPVGDCCAAVRLDWPVAVDEICPIHLIVRLMRPNPNSRMCVYSMTFDVF